MQPLTAEEEALVEHEHLTEAQIAFRREAGQQFRQFAAEEFVEDPESCFLASNECIFDLKAIEKRRGEIAGGLAAEVRDNARLLIFFPPRAGGEYVIGVDPAGGGTDGDFASAQVLDFATAMQCAELRGHYSPQELARAVATLAREYNGALLAVERNNHGHGVLAYLAAAENYENLYEHGNQPGWPTTIVTKPRIIAELAAAIAAHPGLFHSARLLEECRAFVRHQDGSLAAANGANDDCVMALAIALAVRAEILERRSVKAA